MLRCMVCSVTVFGHFANRRRIKIDVILTESLKSVVDNTQFAELEDSPSALKLVINYDTGVLTLNYVVKM